MWVWLMGGSVGGRGRGGVGGLLRLGLCLLEVFFMCVERPQHSNLFHIPKTNQAGYFHSGRGLMAEVGLTRVGGGATEQHMKHLLSLGTCTYS